MNWVEHRHTVDGRAHFVMQPPWKAHTCSVVADLALDCCSTVELRAVDSTDSTWD